LWGWRRKVRKGGRGGWTVIFEQCLGKRRGGVGFYLAQKLPRLVRLSRPTVQSVEKL